MSAPRHNAKEYYELLILHYQLAPGRSDKRLTPEQWDQLQEQHPPGGIRYPVAYAPLKLQGSHSYFVKGKKTGP